MTLTAERVRALLDYDPLTGAFVWKERGTQEFGSARACATWNARYANQEAGMVMKAGYRVISLFKQRHMAQKLAWLLVHGEYPTFTVDFVNGDPRNLSIGNLCARKSPKLTADLLAKHFFYDPETGAFYRLPMSPNAERADRVSKAHGYRLVNVAGTVQYAHRLAFLYMTGELPAQHVDHINGQKDDNRWENLRDVSPAVNSQNRRTRTTGSADGLLGTFACSWSKTGRHAAQIVVDGKTYHLGIFATAEEAHKAYVNAKRQMHVGCTI